MCDTAHQLFDEHMLFERVEDLPGVIQLQIGSLIWGNGLQHKDRDDEAIGFLALKPFSDHSQSSGFPDATWSTKQDMGGVCMLFDPQGELIIYRLQLRVVSP